MPNLLGEQLELQHAKDAISEAEAILLIAHVHPDPDAIGSILGLGAALKKKGKRVMMAVDGGVPRELCFLSGAKQILPVLPNGLNVDLIIALDSDDLPVLGQCGAQAFQWQVPKLVVDHHNFNELYGTINLVQPEYVSTTEALVELLNLLEWDIPADGADALLLGILSDTQLFKVGPIKARTFEIVHQLITAGANYKQLIEKVFSSLETGYLKLLGTVLSKAILEDHVYWTWVTPDDFERYGLKQSARFYVVDDLINDQDAYIAVTFQFVRIGSIRVSMRAIPGFNVGQIADRLGGGGHIRAAGCTLPLENIQQAIDAVVPLLKEEAKRGTSE